jgi:acid phosphatase
MDTINSTLAHGPETRLPSEFYDDKARAIIDRIGVEEWFAGYNENREYRMVGIGGLVGDIVERMTSKVEGAGLSINEIGGENGRLGLGRGGEKGIRFALSGCHDTTLAAVLTSLGAFNDEKWPPYTSHIAFELFKREDGAASTGNADADFLAATKPASTEPDKERNKGPKGGTSFLGLGSTSSSSAKGSPNPLSTPPLSPTPNFSPSISPEDMIARKPYSSLTEAQKKRLEPYYVRIRYNDKIMKIPECAKSGNHFQDDTSICTFAAFKRVADSFTPKNWKVQCGENIGTTIPGLDSPAQVSGGIDEGF